MGKLDGKVAVVTGAATGIGAASASLLAHEGARVVVADIDHDGARAHADAIRATGADAVAAPLDIADPTSVAALFAQTGAASGGIDLLVNNASAMMLTPLDRATGDMDVDLWDQTMATNLRGTMLCCKHAVPMMIARDGGAIVNMSSGQGLTGDTGQTAYAASKAGIMLSLSVATQYGRYGVRCNAVAPGLILTPRLAAKLDAKAQKRLVSHQLVPRLGQARDVAAVVLFLLSDDAAFVTGQVLRVDGGMLSHMPSYADGGNIARA